MALRDVLPLTWTPRHGRASIGGVRLSAIAEHFGTPAYLFDMAHLEARLDEFTDAFNGIGVPVYATKAFHCPALAEMVAARGWWVDVVSEGEAAIARMGGVPASRTLLHGNLKSESEIGLAASGEVGLTVIDSLDEITLLSRAARTAGRTVDVMIRLNESVDLVTNRKVLTTGDHAKFGLSPDAADQAVARVAASEVLRLRGLHLHAGSHIADPGMYGRILERLVAAVMRNRQAFVETPILLDVGGGMASPYLRTDPTISPAQVASALRSGLDSLEVEQRIGPVEVMIEPGRALVANAAVLLYTVGVRKPLPGGGELLALDGGLTDNPRPALYDSQYELLADSRLDEDADHPFRVFGRMCETDVLLEEVLLPAAMAPGDLVAMPAAGAYTFAMSSRYNVLPRPPVLFVKDGAVREVVRRETLEDMLASQRTLREAEPVVV